MGTSDRDPRRTTEVGLRLLATANQLRRALDDDMARNGGSLAQSRLLKVLDRNGPLTQARLAEELGLAARSVTQSVEAMERDGLLYRTTDDADRRVKVVSTTVAGDRALAACDTSGDVFMERMLGGLTPVQLETLDELVGIVAESLPAAP